MLPKSIEKTFLLQEWFKSITKLSNQWIGTSFFWHLEYDKSILISFDSWINDEFVSFSLFTKTWLKNWRKKTCNWRKSWYGIPKVSNKRLLFQEELQSITELLNQGIGTSLSGIKDMINLKQGENIITNKEVKLPLVEFLSDKIQFGEPCQASQSLIVFSSNLSVELVIRKLQSINTIKSAATEIRKLLKWIYF